MRFLSILKLQNTIIGKYLMRNILLLFAAIFIVLVLIIFGNHVVLVIRQSLDMGLSATNLFAIIGLKIIRDLPLIISFTLFLAIVLAISKLYKNSEAVVINSFGLGDKDINILIQPLVVFMFVVILFLTSYLVPKSIQQINMIFANNNSTNLMFIKEGEFNKFKGGDVVFYTSKINNIEPTNEQEMDDVFIYALIDNKKIITLAQSAKKYTDSHNNIYLRLQNGKRYYGFNESNTTIVDFKNYDLRISKKQNRFTLNNVTKVEELSLIDLVRIGGLEQIAELQWRLSQPFAGLILSWLAVLFARTSSRGGKNLGALIGIATFILYYNALLVLKKLIEEGDLSPIIGLLPVHLAAILFIFLCYMRPLHKLKQQLKLQK